MIPSSPDDVAEKVIHKFFGRDTSIEDIPPEERRKTFHSARGAQGALFNEVRDPGVAHRKSRRRAKGPLNPATGAMLFVSMILGMVLGTLLLH